MRDATFNNFVDRVVAFIDLLGFTEIVKSACVGSNSALKRVHDSIHAMLCGAYTINSGPFGGHDLLTPEAEATVFSDCIVISDVNHPAEVGSLLKSAALLSAELLRYRIPCRGGIATGLTIHNKQIVCGMGLIKAYCLERDSAIYPRIIVQDDLVQHATGFFAPCLKRDSDGLWFIDVFKELRLPEDLTTITWSLTTSVATTLDMGAFQTTREFIVAALQENQRDVRKSTKYRWLANQFNEAVKEYIPEEIEPISL